MYTLVFKRSEKTAGSQLRCIREKFPKSGLSIDVLLFIILIILTNTHLVTGNVSSSLAFFPSAVRSGEWWRLITHPFVHLTWYHLLLDAGAFFLLYKELVHNRLAKRFFYVITTGTMSLVAVIISSPMVERLGLCGLSGIAHGLMAVSALEMMHHEENFRAGLVCFLLVVSKSIYEVVIGDVLFSFLHFGLCGTPQAVSHAGGVLGGLVAYCFAGRSKGDSQSLQKKI